MEILPTDDDQVTPTTEILSPNKPAEDVNTTPATVSTAPMTPKPLMIYGKNCEMLISFNQSIDNEEKINFTVEMVNSHIKLQTEIPWDKLQII